MDYPGGNHPDAVYYLRRWLKDSKGNVEDAIKSGLPDLGRYYRLSFFGKPQWKDYLELFDRVKPLKTTATGYVGMSSARRAFDITGRMWSGKIGKQFVLDRPKLISFWQGKEKVLSHFPLIKQYLDRFGGAENFHYEFGDIPKLLSYEELSDSHHADKSREKELMKIQHNTPEVKRLLNKEVPPVGSQRQANLAAKSGFSSVAAMHQRMNSESMVDTLVGRPPSRSKVTRKKFRLPRVMDVPLFPTRKIKESIAAAAIKIGDEIYVGSMHLMAMDQAYSHGASFDEIKDAEQGFITDKGVFLTREEAFNHAKDTHQPMRRRRDGALDSAEIRGDYDLVQSVPKTVHLDPGWGRNYNE